jgi:hypothetical protein
VIRSSFPKEFAINRKDGTTMADYIPSDDAQFGIWAQAFASGISTNPPLYMMTQAQAASIQAAVNDFIAKLAIARNENTRTKPTVIDKDNSRAACESLCRSYAILIKENEGIDDGDKVRIGVRPVNPSRERRDCPQSAPLMNILGNTPGCQTLRFADSNTPDSKAKPFGASELQLFMAVTTAEGAPLSDAKFIGKYTKNPIAVEFGAEDDGKIATYYARWSSVRGDTGPFSLPVSMRVAA